MARGPSGAKRYRKIRRALWEANPHCHFCGCLTCWWTKPTGPMPSNGATLEHLISRLNPIRYQLKEYPRSLFVLACNKCNHERGVYEDRRLRQMVSWNSKEQLKKVLTECVPLV